jgi:threonine aldolase
MRQSGVLAQACLYALDHHLPRLVEDHVRAKKLECGLQELGFSLAYRVDSSMVWVDLTAVKGLTASIVCEELDKVGVRNFGGDVTVMRFVLHQDISDEGAERVIRVFKELKERML